MVKKVILIVVVIIIVIVIWYYFIKPKNTNSVSTLHGKNIPINIQPGPKYIPISLSN